MNKKFLSAILFGALMVTSTGTFVSCKDYDDDIENLQTQIDKNSSAIAELQKLVGQGKWVSSISSIENGFTVTMSDGSSHQIKGINGKDGADGKDGKNGTEWTIGEDGFWYVDGEKTENVAVAKDGKDGKNGVTAPAPSIGADGNWVVYTWDEAKGEFVAEATEIPAAGTAAYAVEADGVYTLHIADENGEYQEIALPATCDSFVALAPAAQVVVTFEQANWTPVKTKADKELFAKMVKEFPELAEYEKGDLMMQGGNLPVIISPANVELTDKYTFALQSAKGVISEAKVSNPVKGMPAVDYCNGLFMQTRSAEANDAYWTLSVEPAKNKKGDKYVGINFNDTHSLIVENEKGTVVKTAFAYGLSVIENEDVTIETSLENVDLEDAIDVLAKDEEGNAVFVINHGLNGYYILEATDALQVEEYGITIEGSKLMIANMPSSKTSIDVDLKLTAVGLNGSVESAETTLTIGQKIAVNATLSDKVVTLGYANNSYEQKVRWNISEELKDFTATQLNQFLLADKKLYITYENEEGKMVDADPEVEAIVAYTAKGAVTTSYKNATTFGFNLDSQVYEPREYTIRLEAETAEGAVIYVAEATLTVVNPEIGESYVKLVPGFVEDGIFQVTGDYKTSKQAILYDLKEALILGDCAEVVDFVDVAYEEYVEEELDDEEAYEAYPWIGEPSANYWELKVSKWFNKNEKNPWVAARYNQLYETRTIDAMIQLFNNPENVVPFTFDIVVKSEIYSEEPTTAIVMDETKLSAVFGYDDATTKDVKENQIDIKKAVTKALVVAGTDKGKTYELFAGSKKNVTPGADAVIDLSKPTTASDLVLGTDGNLVTLSLVDYLKLCDAMNVTPNADIKAGKETYKLTANAWAKIWAVASKYYKTSGAGKYITNAKGEDYKFEDGYHFIESATKDYKEADAAMMAVYNTLVVKIEFTITTPAGDSTSTTVAVKRDDRIASVVVAFNEPKVAAKYFKNVAENGVVFTDAEGTNYGAVAITAVDEAPNDVVGGKVSIPMTMTIRDAWGMTMKVPFSVTVKTVK